MNGNFIGIQVKRLNGASAVINVEAISCIREEKGCIEIVTSCGICYVNCTLEEAIAAVTHHCSALADMPKLGYGKEETEPQQTEPQAESEDVAVAVVEFEPECEHVYEPNPTEKRVGELLDELSKFGRYGSSKGMFDVLCIDVKIGGKSYRIEDMWQDEGGLYVGLKGADIFHFGELTQEEQDDIYDRIGNTFQWEFVYNTVLDLPKDDYIRAHNVSVDPRERILPNTKESLDAFGKSAGELMKSLVNGNYMRDDEWIYLESGELKSTNDPFTLICACEVADHLLNNPDDARDIFAADDWDKAFC